jgi:hypothetical protein
MRQTIRADTLGLGRLARQAFDAVAAAARKRFGGYIVNTIVVEVAEARQVALLPYLPERREQQEQHEDPLVGFRHYLEESSLIEVDLRAIYGNSAIPPIE